MSQIINNQNIISFKKVISLAIEGCSPFCGIGIRFVVEAKMPLMDLALIEKF